MDRVWLSAEVREETIHGGVVGSKAICLDGLAKHLFRFEPPLASLASVLPIGPGTQIAPKTECKLFGPLFGSTNSWEVDEKPTPHSKQTSHVISPHTRSKIDLLMIPGETPGVPLLVHTIAIKGRGNSKQFWRVWRE